MAFQHFLPPPTRAARAGHWIRATWDRSLFVLAPLGATPSILAGSLLSFGGLILFCTCPFIKIDPSLTFMFSLVLMRTGFHFIDSGVRLSRGKLRTHQETIKEYRLFAIKFLLNPKMAEIDRINGIKEILRMNARLDPHMYIYNGPYTAEDLAQNPRGFFTLVNDHVPTLHTGEWAHWYGAWEQNLPFIGKADVMLGMVTFAVALLGFLFLAKPSLSTPFSRLFKEDPYLSFGFVTILASNAISCAYTGSQMVNYDKREVKRARLNESLKQIQNGLEGKRVEALPAAPELRRSWFVKKVKKVTPALAYLSLFVGTILVALGVIYAVVSSGRPIPKFFERLMGNTKVTPHFATAIGLLGLSAIYKGICLKEKKVKGQWKDRTEALSDAIIKTFNGEKIEKRAREILLTEKESDEKWFGRSISKLNNYTCIPHALGGAALIYFGFASLSKISNVSGVVFSATLIIMGFDAYAGSRGAYRVLTYNKRKKEDGALVTTLQELLRQLTPQLAKPIIYV